MRALLALGAVLLVVLVVVVQGGDGEQHRLNVVVPEATNLIKGQEVKAGGRAIGEIDDITALERGAKARITLSIDDDAWPLPQGTTFGVRFGGTASFYNRHILATPGPASAPPLAENATIAAKDFIVPVEVDQLLATFDTDARRDLKSFINRSGIALDRSGGNLVKVLDKTPAALEQGAAVLKDATDDRGALSQVVRRTDSVIDSVRRADPGVQQLITGAATTFTAIAAEQQALRDTVQRLPAMLEQTRSTLRTADGTLNRAAVLARNIGPGVRRLRQTATPLNTVLTSLSDIAPDAKATLATARTNGPRINELLTRATTVSPQLSSISDGAIENLQCIRPWTPEITALLMTWADFHSWSDGKDKVLRAQLQSFLPANYNDVTYTPGTLKKLMPQLRYGFPRPPGYLADQPWYLPQCGAGPDAVDPSKDQEADAAPVAPPGEGGK